MTLADYVYGATIVAHTDAYFVISGSWDLRKDKLSTKIGRLDYDTLQWSLAGQLASSTRYFAGAIFDGTKYVVVGGQHLEFNENCVVHGKNMTCMEQPGKQLDSYKKSLLFMIDLQDD